MVNGFSMVQRECSAAGSGNARLPDLQRPQAYSPAQTNPPLELRSLHHGMVVALEWLAASDVPNANHPSSR